MVVALVVWLLASPDAGERKAVPCKTVADCWLDAEGQVIPRPKRFKGAPLPRGDCGEKIHWLRTHLTCEQKVCVAKAMGDKC